MAAGVVTYTFDGSSRAHSYLPKDGTIITGGMQMLTGTITWDTGDYATGGIAADPSQTLSNKMPKPVLILVNGTYSVRFVYNADPASWKLQIFYFDYNNANDGPAIEYPDATALVAPAVALPALFIGKID